MVCSEYLSSMTAGGSCDSDWLIASMSDADAATIAFSPSCHTLFRLLPTEDLTRSPEHVVPSAAVGARAAPAAEACGACGYQKTKPEGKTHYWSICKLVVDRIQCPASRPRGHKFYTNTQCNKGKCPCKKVYVLFAPRSSER